MKKLLLFLLLIVSAGSIQAQDVIVKKDGSTIICRVVEVTSSEIVYKKWTDLNGSNYVMNRADASAINYENGKKENLGEMTNLYAPNNQNTGAQMLNDRALLQMDINGGLSKAKKMRTKGWIGGIAGIGIGALLINIGTNADYSDTAAMYYIPGGILAIGGITWTTACLIKAHKYAPKADWLQTSNVWQNKIKLKNGSSLTAGVDVLKDQMLNNQTIGVGLSYNF